MKDFELYLRKAGLAENTVRSYMYGVRVFLSNYELKMEDLFEYKGYLLDNFKPKTVNLRLQGINKYLTFIGQEDLKLKFVKIQQKPFLEDVISHADYLFLKRMLKKEGNLKWHFVVWFLGATGARVSELIKLKIEHFEVGYFDIYSKGGKMRRLYIPKNLRTSCQKWLDVENRHSGYLFLNKFGQPITARGIAQQLKNYANKYQLDTNVVYPHSFRHLFAKNFLAKHNDIALLADLMGHESIETTRIYLRKTATEQQAIIDKVVNW
ncbi:tyrosine-type recombinase/integrase [Streptococcus suis]